MTTSYSKAVLCGDIVTFGFTQYNDTSCDNVVDYTLNLFTPLNSLHGYNDGVCGSDISYCMSYTIDKAGGCISCNDGTPTVAQVNGYIIGTNKDLPFKPNTKYNIQATYYIYSVDRVYSANSYTPRAAGTPIAYGDFIVLYTAITSAYSYNSGDANDNEYVDANLYWQTGPQHGTKWNDAIALQPQIKNNTTSDISYQLWVMANPDKFDIGGTTFSGVYDNYNLNSSTSEAIVYGATFLLQSVGKKDSNGNYQFMTIQNDGYNCVISTQSEGSNQPNVLDYNTIFVILNQTAQITLSDGTNKPAPQGNFYTNGIGKGEQNNTGNPVVAKGVPSTVQVQPLTNVEQIQYDNEKTTLDYLSGGLVFYILLIMFFTVLLLVYHIFFVSKEKGSGSDKKSSKKSSKKATKITYGQNGQEIISY